MAGRLLNRLLRPFAQLPGERGYAISECQVETRGALCRTYLCRLRRPPVCLVVCRAVAACLAIVVLPLPAFAQSAGASAGKRIDSARSLAVAIDGYLEKHWGQRGVTPAEAANDATFLRRVTLDLAGRVPTTGELDRYLADKTKTKREKLIQRLIDAPDFALHFGNVLDEIIQGTYAGDEAFVDYLRRGLRDGKSWDLMFREMMLGPWDTKSRRPANRFLDKRAKTLDRLTVDTARVFCGVDVSCAKCHDHPLVEEWTQEHFYGMASFFNRTTGGKGQVGEKDKGDVTYVGAEGKEKTARLMFLSGRVIEERSPDKSKKGKPAISSRRAQLVKAAMEDEVFFRRALVNRLWQYFFGRGLIEPVDQMHAANPPAIPGLIEFMGREFAANGYDPRWLITALVQTRAYGASSRWNGPSEPPAELFAVARLRPLSRRQLAFSWRLVTGDGDFDRRDALDERLETYTGVSGLKRIERYLDLERQSKDLRAIIDPRGPVFQSSTSEALFLSNNELAQQLVRPDGNNLAARLQASKDPGQMVSLAVKTVLTRPIGEDESRRLLSFVQRAGDSQQACRQLLWALLTSAEFRFNH